jgi:hypothetical protein
MSKQRAAAISNSKGASSRGGKKSHTGDRTTASKAGGTRAQKAAAGRKGGKKSNKK